MTERPAPPQSSVPAHVTTGRYEVGAQLGEGGMATVYRAYDRKTGEWCALKVLLPRLSERRGIRSRFASEAQAMMRLAHRNVIHVFDVQTDGPRPFFAMELAEGGCLVDWIETYGPMPPRMAADVAIQICKGIGAAHRAGVIHRDIKPHNILVNRRGVCKITDFGIAQFDDDNASLTKTGSVMGTLGYIAPEQRANAKDVDDRTDIYSIGATLFTLVTARTTMDLFFADQEPELLKGVPEPLIPVILRATRYRRDDRYPTVRALAKALYHARATLPDDPPETPSIIMRGDPFETPNLGPNRTLTTGGVSGEFPVTDSPLHEGKAQDTLHLGGQITYSTPAGAEREFRGPFVQLAPPPPLTPSPPPSRHVVPAAAPSRQVEITPTQSPPERAAPPPVPRGVGLSLAREPGLAQSETVSPRLGTSDLRTDEAPYPRDGSPSLAPQLTGSRAASMPPREALLRQHQDSEALVDWGRVVRRTLAISAPLLVIILTLSSYLTLGASVIDAQRTSTFRARATWFEAVEREQPLVEDLVALGASRPELEEAWSAMLANSDPAARARLTDAWIDQVKRELVTHAPRTDTSRNYARAREARMRIQRLDAARDGYLKQKLEWQRAASTRHGTFAIWMRVAPPFED